MAKSQTDEVTIHLGAAKEKNTENDSSSITEDSTLNDIAQALQLEEKSSPSVSNQLAVLVNGVIRANVPDEVQTQRINAYNRPENCDSLITVKVNPLIWEKLRSETRSADIKLQEVQTLIVKSVIPTVQTIEALKKAKDQVPKEILDIAALMTQLSDGIAFSASANYELNMMRPRGYQT